MRCSPRRESWKESTIILSEKCSIILVKKEKLLKKMNDPGSFSIPCMIGSLSFEKTLTNLGASTNVMPYHVFGKLVLEQLKSTRMLLI